MKTLVLSLFLSVWAAWPAAAQSFSLTDGIPPVRYIEVTGSSELEVDPDEIILSIYIREYWEEEFDRRSKPEDYRTKVPLERIETRVTQALIAAGVRQEDISVQDVGESLRERGRDFLMGKQYQVRVYDFATVNRILRAGNLRGVESFQIAELKNKDIARYREKGKILALQAAREKAQYLLEAAGKRLGDILFIIEPDENGAFQPVQYLESNLTMLSSAEGERGLQGENTVKIKLHYRMRVRFQIADYLQ